MVHRVHSINMWVGFLSASYHHLPMLHDYQLPTNDGRRPRRDLQIVMNVGSQFLRSRRLGLNNIYWRRVFGP